jgi:acyl-CoA thioesterase FadM
MARVKIDLPDKFIFKTEIPIRINDINYGGHLGNDAVLSIAHEARLRFLKQHNFTELNVDGAMVEIAVTDTTAVGCDFVYRCINKNTGTTIAILKTGIVFYDYNRKKVVSVPERFISVIMEK